MAATDLPCPYCHESVTVPLPELVEGQRIECPSCGRQSEASMVPSPTHDDFRVKVWDLRPVQE